MKNKTTLQQIYNELIDLGFYISSNSMTLFAKDLELSQAALSLAFKNGYSPKFEYIERLCKKLSLDFYFVNSNISFKKIEQKKG